MTMNTSQGRAVPYIDALNKIQSSAFKINPYVLDAVKWAWEEGKQFGKFPRRNYLDKPKRLRTGRLKPTTKRRLT